MILLINYANDLFHSSQEYNAKTGKNVGLFDNTISYSPKDIEVDFFEKNRNILSQKKGNGYWLWKPYFIKKSLELLNYGDFLFYCDSGSYFIRPITPIVDISLDTGQDIIPFENLHLEKVWTKRDAFVLMDCDSPEFSESRQRIAGYSLWKKSRFTMNFINELLNYSQDERIITDLENQCGNPNYSEFKAHRHDQSIFSLLTKKYNLKAYRNPSQWGNNKMYLYSTSKYKQLIVSTRRKGYFLPSDKTSYKDIIRSRGHGVANILFTNFINFWR